MNFRRGPDTAYPNLGGPTGSAQLSKSFDFGLPFFYGRGVYVLFEQRTAGAIAGPAVGF